MRDGGEGGGRDRGEGREAAVPVVEAAHLLVLVQAEAALHEAAHGARLQEEGGRGEGRRGGRG